MQKINIFGIIVGHLNTLRDDRNKLLVSDLLLFFGLPVMAGIAFYIWQLTISQEAYGQSITVFSIFAALLLSVQVALYSVSLRPMTPPTDPRRQKRFQEAVDNRTHLMRDLNDNVSYLILLSVCFITLLLAAYICKWDFSGFASFVFGLYVHFFLTILMVVKRASIVFSRAHDAEQQS